MPGVPRTYKTSNNVPYKLKLSICYLFFKESDDPSISDVRNQVCRNVCKEVVHHSDVEIVDHIPDDPQDNDADKSSENEDQDKLNDADNLQESSDKYVDSDHDSVDSGDQDGLMLKTTTDTICLNDNTLNSGGRSGKNCTKKSIYEDYPSLPTEIIPINSPFSTKDIIFSFNQMMVLKFLKMTFLSIRSRFVERKFTSFKQIVFLSLS